ncbi:MAG: epoxyqueuosine reductase QueH [Clostridia bacterium]|nr:epoxyqueuosine reductase QueH [Clostridia bacterium]
MKKNYQLLMEKTIRENMERGRRPSLLLHSCCAPCSSYVLEYLASVFDITLFFYNPNISPKEEYLFRAEELSRLVEEMKLRDNVKIIEGEYDPSVFYSATKGMEELPEGGERCRVCYRLRLKEAARVASEGNFDYFTTTLSISPYKNAEWLNAIGEEEGQAVGVPYLFSDFKKRGGYLRSCELSQEYGLYRQDFCGCIYSKLEKEKNANINK